LTLLAVVSTCPPSSRQERTIFLTIVVVDDSAEYREIVRYLLAQAPDMKIVGEAADGEEALAIVHRARPDILITDLVMPNLNGVELTRRIRRELPHTGIILMSSQPDYRRMAPDSDADVFVNKQVINDTLVPAIRDLVARRVALTSALPQPMMRSQPESEMLTLGDLLYTNRATAPVSEKEWVGLVRSTAGGDRSALQVLYTRTHRTVFTLIVRITNNRETAEDLLGDVFYDVWRRASEYDPAGGSVVGWIMNQTRSRAIERLRFEQREKRINEHSDSRLTPTTPSGSQKALAVSEQGRPTDALRPSGVLWERLAQRIAAEKGQEPLSLAPPGPPESEWEAVAPGISCKLLATDAEKDRVSMLVRLASGAAYPPHSHAGVEELYLLDGELMIDDKILSPGDYNRAEPGTGDRHVWSETGCTCVLLTSTRDVLR
jgi:RNA polymerase sigma factor (sigma-70 family)